MLANQTSFSRMAERMKLDFSAAGIVYFARWITPMNLALRFDTRFFLLAADEQIGPVSLSPEHDAALWTTRAASVGEKEARSLASGDPGYDEIS
ncbi:hypothetical protein [Candidatus Palauibacter sp.]|uniref:hypothetical protein n=1 Tax=Candidatus Palauibacter sp. TaxID=3101350 RepID=UPI003B59F522